MRSNRSRVTGLLLGLSVLSLFALLAQGCGSGKGTGSKSSIVVTTPILGDFAKEIGGTDVEVKTILPVNADPHEYEPRPSDIDALSKAKLIVRSGGELDDWLKSAISSAGGKAPVVNLINSVMVLSGSDGQVDPHWWHDPRNAVLAVKRMEKAMLGQPPSSDKAGSPERAAWETRLKDRADSYISKIESVDSQIAGCFSKVPLADKKLVTTHEALNYLSKRYKIPVVGEIIPSLSSAAQPSAGEIQTLVKRIKAEKVRVIFPEHGLPEKVERSVANEAGVPLGHPLWADSLGPKGSDGATYLQMMAANANSLVEGFTEGRQKCTVRF